MYKYLALFGCLIGFIVATQFNSKLLPNRDNNINEKLDQEEVHNKLITEQDALKRQLVDIKSKSDTKNSILAEDVKTELNNSQKIAGFSEVRGSGLILRLKNLKTATCEADEIAVDLRSIINLLFSLKAEAISINGYRVLFKTPIISVGDNVLVKNFYITNPFEIQVIGNSDFIISAIETKQILESVRKKVENGDFSLEIQKSENMIIPPII